ncbi:Crp/Fnr family transcriptional regulator [Pseudaquabacterium rugosum]|uniref:Crp/Fnr family transcriptional regulator n=1 Tax=Pseudaquabacterium rugosum TaxID=2984194 RepID=A0ABU9BD42_9BURK
MDPITAVPPVHGLPSDRPAARRTAGERVTTVYAGRLRQLSGATTDDASLWRTLFGDALGGAEALALDGLARVRAVGPGQTLAERREPARALLALRSGEVALGLRTADGVFRTERVVRGPAWIDQASAWIGATHAMDAVAQSAATVVELPVDALRAALEALPQLATAITQALAGEVHRLADQTHELMHKDAPARLAQWLHQRCEPVSGQPCQAMVRLHERKRDVASQLAITPETLSRLMRSFTRQGVIEVSGYTLRVLDVEALGRLALA